MHQYRVQFRQLLQKATMSLLPYIEGLVGSVAQKQKSFPASSLASPYASISALKSFGFSSSPSPLQQKTFTKYSIVIVVNFSIQLLSSRASSTICSTGKCSIFSFRSKSFPLRAFSGAAVSSSTLSFA